MVILRQETLLILHPGKAKFLPCWAILAADPQDGPTLALFEDITAKQAIAERLLLTRIASSIRFGSTSWPLLPAAAAAFPDKDPRVDKQLLIALLNIPDRPGSGGRSKMRPSPPIWLCAPSLDQFFGFIKHLSQSMASIGLPAPERSQVESRDALHNYRPWPFQPANDWEQFWDSPAPGLTLMDATKSATVTSMDSHWGGGTYKSKDTMRGFEEMGTAKTSQFPVGKKSAKEGKNGLLKMADLKSAMAAAAVQEQRPTYVHVLPKAAELPEVQLRQMRQASITVITKNQEETSGRWPTQQQQKQQQQWERQNTQQSPVTVIQLLDNAIEEAEAGQPGQRPAVGRKYLDAEVQTDQTMASSAAGFRPILLEAAIPPHHQQQLMNAAAVAADGKKANGRKDEQQNGGRLNSSNSSSNASSEFDQQADGQTETQAKTEVFGLEEDAAGTRFYQVQLMAAVEEKEEEQKKQKKKQNQQQQQQQYEEEATQF